MRRASSLRAPGRSSRSASGAADSGWTGVLRAAGESREVPGCVAALRGLLAEPVHRAGPPRRPVQRLGRPGVPRCGCAASRPSAPVRDQDLEARRGRGLVFRVRQRGARCDTSGAASRSAHHRRHIPRPARPVRSAAADAHHAPRDHVRPRRDARRQARRIRGALAQPSSRRPGDGDSRRHDVRRRVERRCGGTARVRRSNMFAIGERTMA